MQDPGSLGFYILIRPLAARNWERENKEKRSGDPRKKEFKFNPSLIIRTLARFL